VSLFLDLPPLQETGSYCRMWSKAL